MSRRPPLGVAEGGPLVANDHVRRLRAVCLAAARARGLLPRRRWWWPFVRRSAAARRDSRLTGLAYRLALCAATTTAGGMVASLPQAAQLLTLSGILMAQMRVQQLRVQLTTDPALVPLSQLPVPVAAIFDFQLRPVWRVACWPMLDAMGFWAVAWAVQHATGCWPWLPVIAAAHAAVSFAMALALCRLPALGCLPLVVVMVLAWGTVQHEKLPWLWQIIEPLMTALGWLTPWGWLNTLAGGLPRFGAANGLALVALCGMAVVAIQQLHGRLRRTWRPAAEWREVAGRPPHSWALDQAEVEAAGQPAPAEPVVTADISSGKSPASERLRPALALARESPRPGHALEALGWPGRRALVHCPPATRWLADLLAPQGSDDRWWWWCLLAGALPAVCAVLGLHGGWCLLAFAALLLSRRLVIPGLLLAVVVGIAWRLWPNLVNAVGLGGPGAVALWSLMPAFGGTWGGLPQGTTLLGGMPRSWGRMMRIMISFTGWRLVAYLPHLGLALVTAAFAFHPAVAVVMAALWLITLLSVPLWSALQLVRQGVQGIEVMVGGWFLSTLQVGALLFEALAAGQVCWGLVLVAGSADGRVQGALLSAIALTVLLVVGALHVLLLRHAYRRWVDLIPLRPGLP